MKYHAYALAKAAILSSRICDALYEEAHDVRILADSEVWAGSEVWAAVDHEESVRVWCPSRDMVQQ